MQKKIKTAELQTRIPIQEISNNLLILTDGSVAVGYRVQYLEDEALDEADYQHLIKHFTRTVQHFPIDTVIQKLDIYYLDPFQVTIPTSAGLLKQKELAYYQHRPILQHQAFLYICFPALSGTYSPHTTYFAKGSSGLKNPFQNLTRTLETAQKYSAELATNLSRSWNLTRLTDEDNLAALYAYLNLDFKNKPTAFEHTMTLAPGYLQVGHQRLQVISMQSQADEPHYCSYNGLGNEKGVATPFIGPLTHYLPFPHVTIQAIRIVDTEAFLRERSSELAWSQGATREERGLRNATLAQDHLAAFETALKAQGGTMSLVDLQVLVYDADPAVVSERVEETKKQFKRLGIRPFVETYDTANLFFGGMPGAAGQLYRGLPMSLETAVAYLNTIQPRKTGDPTGILLADRHKRPIYYDPFNKKLDNRHAIVVGLSGSGKSFFNGKMIKDRYEAGHRVIVVDSGGTYRRLFQALGGKYIEYSADQPLHLNPFLIQARRGSRKKKTSIRIITQSLEEIKQSPIIGAFKDSSSILILLYNDKASSREEMGKFFGLSQLDMDKYASLSRKDGYLGYREVLIREMNTSQIWMVDTSLYEHAMITSEPDERNRITDLMEEKGDITKGICAWVKEVKDMIE